MQTEINKLGYVPLLFLGITQTCSLSSTWPPLMMQREHKGGAVKSNRYKQELRRLFLLWELSVVGVLKASLSASSRLIIICWLSERVVAENLEKKHIYQS